MKLQRRIVVLILSLGILSTLGTFAYSSISHPVNVQRDSAITGTFVDDSGMFSIASRVLDGAGLIVWPINLAANATTAATAADLFTSTRISDKVNAGDWVIDLTMTNSTAMPLHAVWSISMEAPFDGSALGTLAAIGSVHYFCTCTSAVPSALILTYDIGPNLVTPLSYAITVQRVS